MTGLKAAQMFEAIIGQVPSDITLLLSGNGDPLSITQGDSNVFNRQSLSEHFTMPETQLIH
jgi:hypothetical protein